MHPAERPGPIRWLEILVKLRESGPLGLFYSFVPPMNWASGRYFLRQSEGAMNETLAAVRESLQNPVPLTLCHKHAKPHRDRHF
jgi:hypothetical protein